MPASKSLFRKTNQFQFEKRVDGAGIVLSLRGSAPECQMLTIQNSWETGNKSSLENACLLPEVNGTFFILIIKWQPFNATGHTRKPFSITAALTANTTVCDSEPGGDEHKTGMLSIQHWQQNVLIASEQHLYFCLNGGLNIIWFLILNRMWTASIYCKMDS